MGRLGGVGLVGCSGGLERELFFSVRREGRVGFFCQVDGGIYSY